MDRSVLIDKILEECPICGQVHEIEKRYRLDSITIKGEKVDYDHTFFYCCNADEEDCEFANGKMTNENLLNARNAYRVKHGLLTSDEIVAIRKKYGLSQVELARLLGWGEATISRYESNAIQDDSYDKILRIIDENPYEALLFLEGNKHRFIRGRYGSIRRCIVECLDNTGKEYLSRQNLLSEYAFYSLKCDANGFTLLDIDKLEAAISFLASQISDLFKVKLMKLLWYADSLSFKRTDHTITGLVYCHAPMGALPIGHYKIVALNNVHSQEVELDDYDSAIRFLPNDKVDMTCLTDTDKSILFEVCERLGSYTGSQVKMVMHQEAAYNNTKEGDIIPFSYAKDLKAL